MDEKRLIVFGCSFTYGHGLPDCWDRNEKTPLPFPSKQGWPNKLAKLLNIEIVVNTSRPGASNKEIFRKVLDFNFQKNDIVIILWTNNSRECIFKDDSVKNKTLTTIMPSYIDANKPFPRSFWPNIKRKTGMDKDSFNNFVKLFYENYFNETNSNIETVALINYTFSYLKKIKIRSYHLQDFSQIESKFDFMFMNDINWKQYYFLGDFKIDDALDIDSELPHPGPKSQDRFAKNIYKWFFKK